MESLDKTIKKLPGQSHYRASFTARITEENQTVLQVGRTGKFIPSSSSVGGAWREIAKGRITEVDGASGIAHGEIYTGGRLADLEAALKDLEPIDLLEIDQYGAGAKVLSGLAEHAFEQIAKEGGYLVRRMPEDMARHLGPYRNYDYELEKSSVTRKVEVKSIWGTNTLFARLIHSLTTKPKGSKKKWTDQQKANYYPTSSCKYATQDIFAVNLFLRTGNIRDFAFARSVPIDVKPYGLPRSAEYPDHVNQNPSCTVGDGTWFATIDEVWNLE
jgi:hypothetical protein